MDKIARLMSKRIMPDDLSAFAVEAMLKSGLRRQDAEVSAKVLVTTDTWGVHTHGTRQLRPLMRNVRAGRIDAKTVAEVVSEGPAWAIVDGHYAMPPATSHMAMELAMKKAETAGIGYVGVRCSSHFGAAGFYATMALDKDMIGLAMCNVDPCVTVPGGRGAIMGTNPIAYAVPAGREKPIFLDIATSAVAATKVLAAKAMGKSIPDNWVVDADGLPTTDPSVFPEKGGAMMPMAGYKGYGLALLVEVLSAALTGAALLSGVKSWLEDRKDPTNEGHGFIAMNVGAMMGIEAFKQRMDDMICELKNAPKAKGSDRIYLPGEMEWDRREQNLKLGIQLPDHVAANLVALAEEAGVDFDRFFPA